MVKASVVILTRKEPKEVLECLSKQTFQDFEIIIANQTGIVDAMNYALDAAKGEIFIRVDDDVLLPEKWLESLIRPFSDDIIGGVTGPTLVPRERRKHRDSINALERPGWFLRWLFDDLEYKPAGIRKCGAVSYDSNYQERMDEPLPKDYEPDHLEGTNWAVRTSLIREVGGFDPAFDGVSEWFDDDVIFDIKKLGYKLKYEKDAYLFHLLEYTENYNDRFHGFSRLRNWLRFHFRHSKFHPKMIIWFMLMLGYFICQKFR